MKIAPITNNNTQHRNISAKANMSLIVKDICNTQKSLWEKEGLHKSDEKMFEGKTIKEKWQIRGEYRKKAESNFKRLKNMLKNKFSEYGLFEIEKSSEDNKQHALLKSTINKYVYDFGPIELSPENDNLRDIDIISKLIEKIKNLSRYDCGSINYKIEKGPDVSREEIDNMVVSTLLLV